MLLLLDFTIKKAVRWVGDLCNLSLNRSNMYFLHLTTEQRWRTLNVLKNGSIFHR
ncbi:hypothetical protein CHUAL_007407 [Chamberlinius hualienensis]